MRQKAELRDTQHEIADAVFENDVQMIVAGMGGGKTAAALTAMAELIADGTRNGGLIMAPPFVAATVWDREVRKWEHLMGYRVVPLVGTPAQRLKLLKKDAEFFTLSCHLSAWLKEIIGKGLLPEHLDMFCFDEISFLTNPRSKSGKNLRDIMTRFDTRFGLTGTPRPNGYEDVWGPYQMLSNSALFVPFDDWRRRNFMPKDPSGYVWEVHDFRAREIDAKIAPYTTVVDVELDLPPLNAGPDFDTVVDLPPNARAAYDEMEEELITDVARNVAEQLDKMSRFTEEDVEALTVIALTKASSSAKLAQIAQGYLYDDGAAVSHLHDQKVEALAELRLQAGNENLLIWYGFREDLTLIEKALGAKGRLPCLGGGTTPAQGRRYIEAFGRGEIPNLLAHPASAAHGIDELKNGSHRMIWFCPTWSAEGYEQALARLNRPGQLHPVFSHQIAARGTVDEVKLNRVAYKLQDQTEWTRLVQEIRKSLKG